MVEPVPYVFERLRANYDGSTGVVARERARSPTATASCPFYHLAEVERRRARGAARLVRRDRLVLAGRGARRTRSHIPDIEDRLVETRVPCVTLESLCAPHGFDQLDLLLDRHRGLRLGDPPPHRPRGARPAAARLRALPPVRRTTGRACSEHLHGAGYETIEEGFDTFCLAPGPDDALTRLWQRLEPAIAGRLGLRGAGREGGRPPAAHAAAGRRTGAAARS